MKVALVETHPGELDRPPAALLVDLRKAFRTLAHELHLDGCDDCAGDPLVKGRPRGGELHVIEELEGLLTRGFERRMALLRRDVAALSERRARETQP